MFLALSMLLQASADAPGRIDLTLTDPCSRRGKDADVVVCGRKDSRSPYRLPQIAEEPTGPIKAEKSLGKGTVLAAETEHANVGGFPSNRIMVRLKIKF